MKSSLNGGTISVTVDGVVKESLLYNDEQERKRFYENFEASYRGTSEEAYITISPAHYSIPTQASKPQRTSSRNRLKTFTHSPKFVQVPWPVRR